MTKANKCNSSRCDPSNHDKCSVCNTEIRSHWKCLSGGPVRACHQCPGIICEICCKKEKKLDWSDFYSAWIAVLKPKCIECNGRMSPSEGFSIKSDGIVFWYCSMYCRERSDLIEDQDWKRVREGHAPIELLPC